MLRTVANFSFFMLLCSDGSRFDMCSLKYIKKLRTIFENVQVRAIIEKKFVESFLHKNLLHIVSYFENSYMYKKFLRIYELSLKLLYEGYFE